MRFHSKVSRSSLENWSMEQDSKIEYYFSVIVKKKSTPFLFSDIVHYLTSVVILAQLWAFKFLIAWKKYDLHILCINSMITRPALCPAGSTFWNKTPKSQLPINRISSSFFCAASTGITKSNRMQYGSFRRTNTSKLNFASGRTVAPYTI